MKYRFLLSILRFLVYLKRGLWWIGRGLSGALEAVWGVVWRYVGLVFYKIGYLLKRLGFGRAGEWFTKRGVLQLVVFVLLFFVGWSHTRFFTTKDLVLANQKTLVYRYFASGSETGMEEVLADTQTVTEVPSNWHEGVVGASALSAGQPVVIPERDVATVVAGGAAFATPIIIPGSTADTGRGSRQGVTQYIVVPGDSLGSIANDFGVSVATILWENNLTARSIIRPGDVLKVPPVTGVMYSVKKGDTLKKIANLYQGSTEEIIAFNNLATDGSNLKIGARIMVPNGVPPATVRVPVTQPTRAISRIAAPPAATYSPSASGFTWPSGARTITQYFNPLHHAIDIAGSWQTPTYAAKAGIVEKAQCGWNGGYGCYVVIDHGNGVKTLYAHHSQLLVTPGQEVEQGQTIALMGNSGNVRGHTGIHLHFEVIINGMRVNPLGYVRP